MNPLPHIFTLTGNLLAERTLEFADWRPGCTQRASRETFQVGGKGINVSKMLTRLGAANTALCFTGGAPGAECEQWLQEHGFAYRAFATDQPTRAGTVVRAADQPETTFLGPDVVPSSRAVAACAAFLDEQPDGRILAISGSIPGWAAGSFNALRAALERWLRRGVLVVDTYGPPLTWFAERPVALIKINATELRTLIGRDGDTGAALREPAPRWLARNWVVSDGPHAVWLRPEGGAVSSVTPPPVREVSATGSGDVLLGSLLVSLFHERRPLREAVERAVPLAAANAAHPGIAEFP